MKKSVFSSWHDHSMQVLYEFHLKKRHVSIIGNVHFLLLLSIIFFALCAKKKKNVFNSVVNTKKKKKCYLFDVFVTVEQSEDCRVLRKHMIHQQMSDIFNMWKVQCISSFYNCCLCFFFSSQSCKYLLKKKKKKESSETKTSANSNGTETKETTRDTIFFVGGKPITRNKNRVPPGSNHL
ncbi:hypothetical protein RFI_02494 [Reticulomyxa filosa]|uniref:Uncharacterized protein n=1 Tax=Reticulomyxa filosa TaxID=46433 RepID=X6P959_RETFI|nr:hypothetical protein RFI_02494 [Reticulomyxa filosa]|eukprot:ETO34599.1 hypothetical protein RFI_02494 [Reticulomyxa filosa]